MDELKFEGDECRGKQTTMQESFSSAASGENNEKTVGEAATATDYALSLLWGFRNGRNNNKVEVESNGSNGGSDTNSGLASFGNNSFLFQFDGEEGGLTNGSFPTSESDNKIGGSDSDGEGRDSRSSGDGPRIDPAAAEVSHSTVRTVSGSSRTNSSAPKDLDSIERNELISSLQGAQGPNAVSIAATSSSTDERAPLGTSFSHGASNTNKKRTSHPSCKSSISSITMSSQNDALKTAPFKGGQQKSIAREGNARLGQTHHDDGVRGTIHVTTTTDSYQLDHGTMKCEIFY